MKKAFIIIACVAAMLAAGTGLKAQEVTITLMPGWTWISIPSTETMDFATALGSFTPAVGDKIKSQWGNATYRGNGEWRGQISEFYPGYGYMYYSTRQVPVSVTFNAQQPTQQVVVTTDTPQFITGNSAMGGGNVASNDGTYILVKGLCWATHEAPTSNDSYLEEGSGEGSFSATMTGLNWSTTYYVRAYAVTPNGTVYGDQKTFTTRDGIPEVSTDSVTNILGNSAICGGNVTDNGGLNVTACGVCWSTSHNPTVSDSHTTDGTGTGSFTSSITNLEVSTTYYVRAYATTTAGTGYGEEVSFSTQSSSVGLYVDLGLPSGTLWAICNVGADSPEGYGDYYAWGETQPKDTYDWSSYQYCYGSWNTLTKYCSDSNYGYNGFTDNLTILLVEDDAATANWGAEWRMPTKEEWQELFDNTIVRVSSRNEVEGRCFTAANGNSFFLPAAGYYSGNSLIDAGYFGSGHYWSSSLFTDHPNGALYFNFNSDFDDFFGSGGRLHGQSVRAVRCKNSVISVTANPVEGGTISGGGTYMDRTNCTLTATANENYTFTYWTENGEVVSTDASYTFTVYGNHTLVANFIPTYVDLGLPSGLLWATCNVDADYPEDYGSYFAWGETQPKNYYEWSTYQYSNGSSNELTKYCNNSNYGYNSFIDNQTILLPEDDAASINWSAEWRMPSKEDWQELLDNTTCTWTNQYGVNGRLFTASNGNSIFLPAAGNHWDYYFSEFGGLYWSSSLDTDDPLSAWFLYFESNFCYVTSAKGELWRFLGYSVRPVRCKNSVINLTANPTEGGSVSGGGTYMDHTSCTVTATANEGYVFACWTENGEIVSTDSTYTFVVNGNRTLVASFNVVVNGHGYIDLGLPSGTLWATCNVGADYPEDYGDYFAWGETQPKDTYNWSTYQYCNGSYTTLTKYCNNSSYGYNGFTDDLTTLLPEDDAATANWGSGGRMPTKEEWQELYNNTTVTWTTQNGVNGRLFTASNGNSLFLPAAGYRYLSSLGYAGISGYYWSSSLSPGGPYDAWYFYFNSDEYYMSSDYRGYGFTVRPVCSSRQN